MSSPASEGNVFTNLFRIEKESLEKKYMDRQKRINELEAELKILKEREQAEKLRRRGERTFLLTCTMKERWIPHFMSMLKYMQYLGGVGSSRKVSIYADGDGDFRPKFMWDDTSLPTEALPVRDDCGNRTYDAG